MHTRAGVVTLFGIVPSQDAKGCRRGRCPQGERSKAGRERTAGGGKPKQAAVKVRDDDLEREVKKAFETQDFKDITVDVKNGVVRLTGITATGARRLEAAALARSVQGVRAVEDDLRLATAER
jgi:osmotically-inducible protein OsmY